MQNPAETMRKLRRLAQGSTNEAESETARQALAALMTRYPSEASLLETPIEVDVPYTLKGDSDFELDLFVTISEYLGCSVVRKVGSRRTKVIVRGPRGVVDAVLEVFPVMWGRVGKLLKATYCGFKTGAFSMLISDRSKTSSALELSNEELALARAGYAAGQSANPRRALQPARTAGG